jgi:hypothetical protein
MGGSRDFREVDKMRKVTTVSLDEKTAQIAKQMPNFSHFVRECLLRHHASSLNRDECVYVRQERFANRCVPRVKGRPVCFVCWPHGRPSQDLVTQYLRDHNDITRLDRETKAENWQLLNLDQNITVQELDKLPSKGGVKANLWVKIKRFFG